MSEPDEIGQRSTRLRNVEDDVALLVKQGQVVTARLDSLEKRMTDGFARTDERADSMDRKLDLLIRHAGLDDH